MDTHRVPRIRPRKDHREIKWLVTFYIDEADQVQSKDGEWFVPVKVEAKNWPRLGRSYVTVTGPTSRRFRGYPGVANFNLKGSPQYPACPDWLITLIKEAMSNAQPTGE